MCGIFGFLDRRSERTGSASVLGQTLLTMLNALGCRGPDSAGVALYTEEPSDTWIAHVAMPEQSGTLPAGLTARSIGAYTHVEASGDRDPAELERELLGALPGAEVISIGRSLRLFKQVGSPEELETIYGIRRRTGTHGIGHTRMSTESKIDLSHSQPFWAHGVPDLATVHNGHITNYHKLRRRFEQKGYRFYTENDSEVIGVYLTDRLAAGLPFEDALRASLDDFDGSFCYLAATADRLAYLKDGFGFKPLVVAETDDFVAIATEEIALRKALGTSFAAKEPPPGSVGVWAVTPREVGVGE